ncbi:MAG: type II toxin-antitoxin system RelE/ParE family toxin [Lysobacter sp.]|nr:type II toxin-antitoxin system RelE/ParE family toxin [Lysobacter sp.]
MRRYRLAAAAQSDIVQLLAYTQRSFGVAARQRYQTLLLTALRDVAAEPERIGSVARSELGEQVRSYHLRHSRDRAANADGFVRRPRHLLLFRWTQPELIDVARVLHDAMEIERHLPTDDSND